MNDKNNVSEQTESRVAVRAEGLRKDYYQGKNLVPALRGVDLTIPQGDFVAIMGASGSGKSTLLHLAAGLVRPSSGTVVVDGENLGELSDARATRFRRRDVGIVFQNYNLVPHLTAAQNILLPLVADGKKERLDSGRAAAILAKLEISPQMLKQYPDTMSGGQQQRIAIARALIANPPIIFADEPTGNLDSVASRNICEIFAGLNADEGRTIVLVTHEPAVAVWAKRVVVLADGRIVADSNDRSGNNAGFASGDRENPEKLAAAYQKIVVDAKNRRAEEAATVSASKSKIGSLERKEAAK